MARANVWLSVKIKGKIADNNDTMEVVGDRKVKTEQQSKVSENAASGAQVFSGGAIGDIDIQGFKSLENINLALSSVNVLVGANGTGKSNLLGFFGMLGWAIQWKNLQRYIAQKGGSDELLFNGAKNTNKMRAGLTFTEAPGKPCGYRFCLQYTDNNRLAFTQEEYNHTAADAGGWVPLGSGHDEAKVAAIRSRTVPTHVILETLKGCGVVYQFKDTSPASPLRLPWEENDALVLRDNGRNLAPVLYNLRESHPSNYDEIVRILREAVPAFSEFELEPDNDNVALHWWHRDKKMPLGANLTSDGTLRFMALVTLMNMPPGRVPNIVLLDEPELGLHPYAIWLLGALIRRLSADKQIIIATQSPLLVNEFAPEDVVVTEMDERGATSFERPDAEYLKHWLDEFQLGELWQKNVMGGNP